MFTIIVSNLLLKEQKTTNQTITDLIAAVNAIGSKVDDVKKELDNPKSVLVTADTKPIQQIVQKGLTDVKLMIGTQPKSIIRKFQILLFPEQDAKLFYKVAFSRWFLWLAILPHISNGERSAFAIGLDTLQNADTH